MKKQIISFLILIFTAAGLAAETGWQGFKWYSDWKNFPTHNTLKTEEELRFGKITAEVYKKTIMGEQTYLYLAFSNSDQFIAAGYTLSKATANKVIENLGPKIKQYKATTESREERNMITNKEKAYADFFIFAGFENVAEYMEQGAMEEQGWPEGDGRITIYNYNDDTYAYVFENFYDKRTTIVFIPHFRGY